MLLIAPLMSQEAVLSSKLEGTHATIEDFINYDAGNAVPVFKDGNGRIGRLLIPLFLYYRDMLPVPTFYMSAYFEKDRSLYLEKLSAVSKDNDYATLLSSNINITLNTEEIRIGRTDGSAYLYIFLKISCFKEIVHRKSPNS